MDVARCIGFIVFLCLLLKRAVDTKNSCGKKEHLGFWIEVESLESGVIFESDQREKGGILWEVHRIENGGKLLFRANKDPCTTAIVKVNNNKEYQRMDVVYNHKSNRITLFSCDEKVNRFWFYQWWLKGLFRRAIA